MRLDNVYIDGFKNLKDFEIDFAEEKLTAVIIGQNGTGKSNLIEAIATIFRDVDLNRKTHFHFEIHYRLGNRAVRIANRDGKSIIEADGISISRKQFDTNKDDYFPALVFGYYSGTGRRLEAIFDDHQKAYYREIIRETEAEHWKEAARNRRLFYCRTIHGAFAMLALQATGDPNKMGEGRIAEFFADKLGVTGFHSALALLKQPSWYSPNRRGRGRQSYNALEEQAEALWGARGLAGDFVRRLQESAFLPIALQGAEIDDYRQNPKIESQYACFVRDTQALAELASNYTEREFFTALEAVDISDLIRRITVWVYRNDDQTGDVSFEDLSDGERQLLMVLGMIRISAGENTLFLLDEPDTHLNPVWQHTYLDLIREWSGIAAERNDFHIIMTSHNPLTVAGLTKKEVHVMYRDEDTGRIENDQPNVDPKGLGVAGVLRQIFGMRTTLDPETQELIDERNRLLANEKRDQTQEVRLQEMNEQIRALGISLQNQQDLFEQFLQALDEKYLEQRTMTPRDIVQQNDAIKSAIAKLKSQKTIQ